MRDCATKRILLKIYYAFLERYTAAYSKFHPIIRNKIVLDSYGGQAYGDNPKYIAEEIHRQNLKWDIVWLTNDMSVELPSFVRPVQYGSYKAKRELSTAKIVVNNKRNSMRMPKKRGQIFLQTWHGGLGFKRVEAAVEDKLSLGYVNCAKRDGAECDAIISACALQTEDYKKNFWLNEKTEILEIGQPRCDALFSQDAESVKRKVRTILNVSEDKSILLYTPTFRDEKTIDCFNLDFLGILNALEKKTGKEYIVIIRLHPNIQNLCHFLNYDERIINGSMYPDIQELFLASDMLITDYSSAAFDFALLNKPVFLCMLDYEEYLELRGLSEVFAVCPFPKAYSNEQMVQTMHRFSQEEYNIRFAQFKDNTWKPFDDGFAAKRTVEWLRKRIAK